MECKEFELELDLHFPKNPTPTDLNRSPGLHVTDIIKDIMDQSGMLSSIGGNSWGPNQLWLAGEVGFMWEEIFSSALKARLPNRIGEIEVDGVIMSPDGLDVEPWELWEYKAVWSSSKRKPVDIWKWMTQVKAYCKGLGTLKVKMAILYLMGDWKGAGPEYRGFEISFTPLEIQENWEMIIGHAERKGWL